MKNYSILFYILVISIFTACTQQPTEQSDNNPDNTEETTKQATTPDFDAFVAELIANAGNYDYVMERIEFPYPIASSTNEMMSKDDFIKQGYGLSLLEDAPYAQTAKWDDGYLNGYLSDYFTSKFGDLKNIYTLTKEPESIGYIAYFRLHDNSFRFIGYEILEIAD